MEKTGPDRVLYRVADLIGQQTDEILTANAQDMAGADSADLALYDRLKLDLSKIQAMQQALIDTAEKPNPVGIERYRYQSPDGLLVINKTAPFGTILIIYESRPDVTIEAAAIAFKAGNKILLKGGTEARRSNLALIKCWQQALAEYQMDTNWVQYLDFDREATTDLLLKSEGKIDLIVPRGGEMLIRMVKSIATAPVLVSGRGNNFIYLAPDADPTKARMILVNSKLQKISGCNAADKILFDSSMPELDTFLSELISTFTEAGVQIMGDVSMASYLKEHQIHTDPSIWYEEFLSKKIFMAILSDMDQAITVINTYSGKHTAVILTEDKSKASQFMDQIDSASVIHNASSRFTDGGQFGLGAELAISTDKIHHRGPMGLDHLVTNKWYVFGNGQIRR
jgi:glutamate-5-semialdehyde dehydrogenase